MTPENFKQVLSACQRRTPFRQFTVNFVSGERIQIDNPEALMLRGGVAVFLAASGVPTLFDHESVSQVDGKVK